MEYKPIYDKVMEFVEFSISVVEELSGEKLERGQWYFRYFETTRKHLVYSARGRLNTPFGSMCVPYRYTSDADQRTLNARLVEKFNLVEIRPDFNRISNRCSGWTQYPPIYYVPLDPEQPDPELPPPDERFISLGRTFEAYQPRMDSVFRRDESVLLNQYCKIKTGMEHPHLCLERASLVNNEFNKWRNEVAQVDDQIPVTFDAIEAIWAKLGIPK
jgi:hypothetical protein